MTDKPAHDRAGHDDADRSGVVYAVTIDGVPGDLACRADQTVIQAMRAAGRSDLSYGCQGGGCGACRVVVKAGRYVALPMSAACVSPEQQKAGLALACRIKPRGQLTLIPAPMRRTLREESRAA